MCAVSRGRLRYPVDIARALNHLLNYSLPRALPPLGHLAIPNNNSQSQALEAEARRGLESEMMCMPKGPQTFQSQVLLEAILDLDPREGGGSENGQPKPFQPAALHGWVVFVRSPASQDAQVIVCFPSS